MINKSWHLPFVQTLRVKVRDDSEAVAIIALPTCAFTSRHGDPVCCPRFPAYWITSGLKHSSPKKAKAQSGLEMRPRPSALKLEERSRSDATESLSSMSSEQSGLICSSWAPVSLSSLSDRTSASEGLSSLPPTEWPLPSMTPKSELSAFTPGTVNKDRREREREGLDHMESIKKANWICEVNRETEREREIQGWRWGCLLLTLSWLHNALTV